MRIITLAIIVALTGCLPRATSQDGPYQVDTSLSFAVIRTISFVATDKPGCYNRVVRYRAGDQMAIYYMQSGQEKYPGYVTPLYANIDDAISDYDAHHKDAK